MRRTLCALPYVRYIVFTRVLNVRCMRVLSYRIVLRVGYLCAILYYIVESLLRRCKGSFSRCSQKTYIEEDQTINTDVPHLRCHHYHQHHHHTHPHHHHRRNEEEADDHHQKNHYHHHHQNCYGIGCSSRNSICSSVTAQNSPIYDNNGMIFLIRLL